MKCGRGWPADDLKQLSTYSVGLVLDNYFQGGALKLSRPVFADEKRNAVLCPTAEALFYILSSFPSEVLATVCCSETVGRSASGTTGGCFYGSLSVVSAQPKGKWIATDASSPFSVHEEATAFSTSSTIAFFHLLEQLLDALADKVAKEAMDVPSAPCSR